MSGLKRFFGTSALALLNAMTISAAAQEPVESEEIVVTVQKREQLLRDVPMAVTAYDQDFLNRVGVTKFDELAVFTPGLEIQEQSPNNPGFVIRGVTSDSGEANIEPRVAIFQDGVSISRSRGSYVELFDLERVEIAKGPQATLFGRGALIGGINLIQKKADTETISGGGEIAGGDYGYFLARAAFNAPLIKDKLAVRAAISHRERDGYVDNALGGADFNGGDTDAGRLSVRFEPTNALKFDLIANYQEDDTLGTAFKSGTFAAPGGDTSPYTDAALNTFGGFEGNKPLGLERIVRGVTLLGEWKLSEAFTLSSISATRDFKSMEVFDPDGSAYPITVFAEDARGEQWSQEFRLNWDNGGRLTGFVGASFMHEEGSQRVPLQFDEAQALALIAGATDFYNAGFVTASQLLQGVAGSYGYALAGAQADAIAANLKTAGNAAFPYHRETFTNYGETDSIDIYADATFAVTERLELTAGVRWTQDDKTSGYDASVDNGRSVLGAFLGALQAPEPDRSALLGALTVPGAAGIPPSMMYPVPLFGIFAQPSAGLAQAEDTFDDFTWRLVARYELTDSASLWASYARGRRPEVLSTAGAEPVTGAVEFETIPAETADSFEIGAKTRTLGGALDLDGSVYFYKYNDFQTTEFQGAQIVTVNAGEAQAYGFEGAALWRPMETLDLFLNYAYSHARIDGGARDGNAFRLSPDHSVALGGTMRLPVGGAGHFFVTPTYTWQSEIFFDDDNDQADLQDQRLSPAFSDFVVDEVQDSYGLLNVRAGFAATQGWTLGAFVTNATDEEYLIDAGNTGDTLGIPTFVRGAPRMWGLEAKAAF